ncbi:hypothetical protein C8Q74DRAFT_586864 [Fomes fomentarius]|nr:hypothetical protein C8Q74DRAFT_586864 [Fomes fomentarius]
MSRPRRNIPALMSVFSVSLDAIRQGSVLDLTPQFHEERYRFIDADAFIQKHTLDVYETTVLPSQYTVISYVWFGLVASHDALERDGSFRVHCGHHHDGTLREDGGPISLKVLEYACKWASDSSTPFLWLDRLCIMQSSQHDKAWQIGRMYAIYQHSEQCIVLPGGLQRLASVDDETSWASRAWTYQEAIATWDYAVVLTKDWYRPKEDYWLVEGECHWEHLCDLFVEGDGLLDIGGSARELDGTGTVAAPKNAETEFRNCLIFGRNAKALHTMRRIMEYLTYNQSVEGGDNPEEEQISEHAIRQHLLQGVAMRTSSRPVDMVLSILGLFGAEESFPVDVGSLSSHQRFRATLALVEAVLRHKEEHFGGGETTSSLIDVPLWESLTIEGEWDECKPPTLGDLEELFDGNATKRAFGTGGATMTRSPLQEWLFDADWSEEEPDNRAEEIAGGLPESLLLQVYEGTGHDRVVVHDDEGEVTELCDRLVVAQTPVRLEDIPLGGVFGWSLRLGIHPYMRFYFFGITS